MSNSRHHYLSITCLLVVIALLTTLPSSAAPTADNMGNDFWIAIPENVTAAASLSLYISASVNTTGTVDIPGLGWTQNFNVTAGMVTGVSLPMSAQANLDDGIENKGIHVTSVAEVAVYGLSEEDAITDAFLALPTDVLGTEYVVMAYGNAIAGGFNLEGSQFSVAATQNATTLTITPSVTTGTRTAGVPYNITLDQGEVYTLTNNTWGPTWDLTGTIITSDKPVAVFGSHECAFVPDIYAYCDYLIEQLPPTSSWGQQFVSLPLATRVGGDTFRFLASEDNTTVSVNGATIQDPDGPFLWDWGDGTMNRSFFPNTHSYHVPGFYHITVEVSRQGESATKDLYLKLTE